VSNARNGPDESHRIPTQRLRVDDLAAIVLRNSPGPTGATPAAMLTGGHSGRRFVLAAGMTVLLIWGTLYLFFRDWRARYRERALYGATQIVPAIDPLRSLLPADVDHVAWRDAVDQTRAMLITVTGSNLLDVNDMGKLRLELGEHVRRACDQPATALVELAEIWNEVADRGEFLLRDTRSLSGERHPRPRIIPSYGATRVVPALDPLLAIVPPGVDPVAWREAFDQTRTMLLTLTDSSLLDVTAMGKLRGELSRHVSQARAHPETALDELAKIWKRGEFLLKQGGSRDGDRRPRPKILAPGSPEARR
jgi:hypothetical protein